MATTISISTDTEKKLKNLLQAYLYDESDSVPIDEAIARAKRR